MQKVQHVDLAKQDERPNVVYVELKNMQQV